MKPSIAFVVQRCGPEVNGGAEAMCLSIARRLSPFWDIEILTTCALDYMTWADSYPPGLAEIDGVKIRRFPVDFERPLAAFNELSARLLGSPQNASLDDAEEWMRLQGPISSHLSAWVQDHVDKYESFFFFTYLYASTYKIFPLVAHKAVLIPNAHDEPPIYLPIFKKLFNMVRLLACNTSQELAFIQRNFPKLNAQAKVVGLGVDIPKLALAPDDLANFRIHHGLEGPFILYVGRIDESKGCAQLFDYWERYKLAQPSQLKLLLVGQSQMIIPKRSDILHLGFVDEITKRNAIAACEFLINPSPYESLSLVLLEAWMEERPTLVNGACEVLKAQTIRTNGGLWYDNYEEFKATTDYLLNHTWTFNGREFLKSHYLWSVIINEYQTILKDVRSLQQNMLSENCQSEALGQYKELASELP